MSLDRFRFYLGTDAPSWLWRVADVPLFVSHRPLSAYKELHPALAPWALDSGGFTEVSTFGEWRTTPATYVAAVRRYRDEIGRLEWASPQDWMCEPHIIAKTGLTVAEHQARTIANYLELRALAPDLPFVPVLQGWELDDYRRHIDGYTAAGVDLLAERTVGIGSVCRRQRTGQIERILAALAADGLALHGFGLKLDGIRAGVHHLRSADSMAWSFGGRMTHRRGCDCTRCATRPGEQVHHCGGSHRSEAHCLDYALRWRRRVLTAATSPRQLALEVAG